MQPNIQPNPIPEQPAPIEAVPTQAVPQPVAQPTVLQAPTIPQAPVSPQAPMTQQPPIDETKKIKNAAQSAFVVGLVMTLFGILGIGVTIVKNAGLGQLIATICLTALFVAIMVLGQRLKKSVKPLSDISLIMALSFLYVLLALGASVLAGGSPGLGFIIALVLGIYLAVARRNIHNK